MILVVAFAFIFAACNDEQEHTHSFVEGSCECGEKDPNYVTPHTHSYSSVVTAPTCTEAGYTTFTCECGDTYKEDGEAALGHTEVVDAAVDPTCTEAGKTEGKHCSVCNEVFVAQEEIAALGHKFVDSKCENCEEQFVAPVGDWTLVTEIKNGDNVLIGAPAYNKLLSAVKTGFYNKGIDYSVDDFSNVTDAEIFVVTDNGDGTYTFTSLTGDVIALAASYSSLNADGQHKSWSLVDKGNGLFLLKNTGRNTYLEWYASKNNWSTYTAGNTKEYELSFYAKGEATDVEHVHNHISSIHEATCTEAGYTAYTCRCGDTYKVDGEAAKGHSYSSVVTAPTCTAAGVTTYTCSCGDTYTEETEKLGHVDANLDIDCDREGCTSKVAPQAGSTLSNFTANNLGSKLSTSSNYYVEGTISDVLDAKNGIFYLDDGTGEKFYFRLPKNEEGVSYASWTVKLVLGDKVRVYGKINKFTASTAPNGQYYPAIQGGTVTYIEQHPHVFGEPTCFEPGYCECGQAGPAALGHSDVDANGFCDVCEWNMKHYIEKINTHYSAVKDTENCNTTEGTCFWAGEEFKFQLVKGSGQFNTNGTNHFRWQNNNILTISSLNGNKIVSITFVPTTEAYVDELQIVLEKAGYNITTNGLEVTINIDSLDTVSITNTASKIARIASVKIVYEKSAE